MSKRYPMQTKTSRVDMTMDALKVPKKKISETMNQTMSCIGG
jgi:hypothetical protein